MTNLRMTREQADEMEAKVRDHNMTGVKPFFEEQPDGSWHGGLVAFGLTDKKNAQKASAVMLEAFMEKLASHGVKPSGVIEVKDE